jgi:hypothetical protein
MHKKIVTIVGAALIAGASVCSAFAQGAGGGGAGAGGAGAGAGGGGTFYRDVGGQGASSQRGARNQMVPNSTGTSTTTAHHRTRHVKHH